MRCATQWLRASPLGSRGKAANLARQWPSFTPPRWPGFAPPLTRAPSLADAIHAHFARDGGAKGNAALQGQSIDDPDLQVIIAFLDALTDQKFVHDPRFSLPKSACGKPL
jgi:hypothetical protein